MYPPSWEKDNRQPQTALQSGCQVVLCLEVLWWIYAFLTRNNLDMATFVFLMISPVITLLALISMQKSVWRTAAIAAVILFLVASGIFLVVLALMMSSHPALI